MTIAMGGFLVVVAVVFALGLISAKRAAKTAYRRRTEIHLHSSHAPRSERVRNAPQAREQERESDLAMAGSGNKSPLSQNLASR